jgi:hypothetical protein
MHSWPHTTTSEHWQASGKAVGAAATCECDKSTKCTRLMRNSACATLPHLNQDPWAQATGVHTARISAARLCLGHSKSTRQNRHPMISIKDSEEAYCQQRSMTKAGRADALCWELITGQNTHPCTCFWLVWPACIARMHKQHRLLLAIYH